MCKPMEQNVSDSQDFNISGRPYLDCKLPQVKADDVHDGEEPVVVLEGAQDLGKGGHHNALALVGLCAMAQVCQIHF